MEKQPERQQMMMMMMMVRRRIAAGTTGGAISSDENDALGSGRAQVLSIRVLRILRLGATPASEIRYFPRGGYSTFVLNWQTTGWLAS